MPYAGPPEERRNRKNPRTKLSPEEARERALARSARWRDRNRDKINADNRARKAAERRARGVPQRDPNRDRYANGRAKPRSKRVKKEGEYARWLATKTPEYIAQRTASKIQWFLNKRRTDTAFRLANNAYVRKWRARKKQLRLVRTSPQQFLAMLRSKFNLGLGSAMLDDLAQEAMMLVLEGANVEAAVKQAFTRTNRLMGNRRQVVRRVEGAGSDRR